jgi:phosphate transport system permease protein
VFLAAVVWPLFGGAVVSSPRRAQILTPREAQALVFAEIDEKKTVGVALGRDGGLVVFDAATGAVRHRRPLFDPAPRATAFARDADGAIAIGFEDGTVRLGRVAPSGDDVDAKLDPPLGLAGTGAVALLDYKKKGDRDLVTVLRADGALSQNEVSQRETPGGDVRVELEEHPLPFEPAATAPAFLVQNRLGDQVYVAWSDGAGRRYDLRDRGAPAVAETFDLVPDASGQLTDLRFMLGDQSLIAGDSLGGINVWFRVARPGTRDGYRMVVAHHLEPHGGPVVRSAISSRDKSFLTATAGGEVWLRHMTSERVLSRLTTGSERVAALQLAPKGDGIFALDAAGNGWLWDLSNPHPETTLRTLFGRVWYEGYDQPSFTWQSSSGSDDFEPKLSLVPLVFGTLKATFYAMLFAVPIALAAAIYTSQFLHRDLRLPIKSVVETMASLPSVVLGFVAALVLAPVIESWVTAVMVAGAVVPLAALTYGYLWQLLPKRIRLRLQGRFELPLSLLGVAVAIWAAVELAGPAERVLFAGDFKGWLDGAGGARPGLAILAWPIATIAAWLAQRAFLGDRIDHLLGRRPPMIAGLAELARFFLVLAAGTAVAWLVGGALAGMGFDPRHSLVGTYVQRNTLIVGFVMGFAVIPIVYTIAEDALASVPEHLRTASLACGATPWQTAVRVIVPVAMSGIFSGVMIGLGRAVGETMIVVMAAGNTPVMDLNVFNGLRALSANIVVELPEAVRDSTLYRMLFLAALTLFAVTFVVNTVAEMVRMRFRKRAFQL